MSAHDDDRAAGKVWREFGLRKALADMPSDSPGRRVVEALLAGEARGDIPTESFAQVDLVYQLERLASLRERGQLTEAEFATAKAKLLG